MTAFTDLALRAAIESLIVPGITVGHRVISLGDEFALREDEGRDIASSVVERRRASGAARLVARDLLRRLGHGECAIPRAESGAPVWPPGVVGSLAHDLAVAVAAVASGRDICALGVDIEPAEPLPSELIDIVATPDERRGLGDDRLSARLLFVAKEAVYKAVNPLDSRFLEHHDVRIDFSAGRGFVRDGRTVELRHCVATHLIVVAFIPQCSSSP